MSDPGPRFDGATALVVDDDTAVRLVIRRLLERLGFAVEEAVDGTAALQAVGRRRFSLVVTDLEMPRLDGIAFLHEARSRGLDAAVVFLTAVGSVTSAVEAIKGGAFEFLEKPLRADRLLQVVRAAMEHQAAASLSIPIDLPTRPHGGEAPAAAGPAAADGRDAADGAGRVERIGRYEIRARLGRGGMGEVFQCWDPLIGRAVAVKVLQARAEWTDGAEQALARFRREAAAAGTLAHPGIVGVYDLGQEPRLGLWYIVLELIDGQGLNVVLAERQRLPADEVVALGFQIADALAFAHARGVVHRDIKPSNVFVRPDGTVKLLDFGLAAMQGWNVTQGDRVFGSPSYMAPERIRGKPGGPAADQFSLGVVLYEALAGDNPFQGPTPETRLLQVLREEPPRLSALRPEVPVALSDAVARLMAKAEEHRFPDTDAAVEEFGRIAAALGHPLHRLSITPAEPNTAPPATAR